MSISTNLKGAEVKTEVGSRFNIVLVAMTLLLLFVVCFTQMGITGSWLVDKDTIGFKVSIGEINIKVYQGEREVADEGMIYLGTDVLEAGVSYLTTESAIVTVKNEEKGEGYYIRFQAIAMVNGVAYNINQCIKGTDFVNKTIANQGDWLYSVDGEGENVEMEPESSLIMLKNIQFSKAFVNTVQGQYFKLYLYIQGSPDGVFA